MPFTKTGKVQVQRVVSRGGKTFTQMFWVKPDQVKATDKVVTPAAPTSVETSSDDVFHITVDDLQNTRKSMGTQFALDTAKMAGITWAHSDNPSINWMRCMMAVKKASGVATPKRNDKQLDTPTLSTSLPTELGVKVDNEYSPKLKIAMLVSAMGRGGVMQWAKNAGIKWKESDKPGVNWMRCSMAVQKQLADHSIFDEVKPSVRKTYKVPKTACHIPNDSPFDKCYKELQDGEIDADQAKQRMLSTLKSMGMEPKFYLGDWNDKFLPAASVCNIGRAYTAMKTEFPGLMSAQMHVENPYESEKKGWITDLSEPGGDSTVAYVSPGEIRLEQKSQVHGGASAFSVNSVVFNMGADQAICWDSDYNQAKVVYDASHEFTHHLQFHMVKQIVRAGWNYEGNHDNYFNPDTDQNIELTFKQVNMMILKNAVKHLPAKYRKDADSKTPEELVDVFSPTRYGRTNAGECVSECMACHMTGTEYDSKTHLSSGPWYEAVYASTCEIYDTIEADPLGMYKLLRGYTEGDET